MYNEKGSKTSANKIRNLFTEVFFFLTLLRKEEVVIT